MHPTIFFKSPNLFFIEASCIVAHEGMPLRKGDLA